jgi:hypothetical protein
LPPPRVLPRPSVAQKPAEEKNSVTTVILSEIAIHQLVLHRDFLIGIPASLNLNYHFRSSEFIRWVFSAKRIDMNIGLLFDVNLNFAIQDYSSRNKERF